MHRSLKIVTVSARFISGPDASTIVNNDSARTRIVADPASNTWRTSTGRPSSSASIRNSRLGPVAVLGASTSGTL